ncbi:MAG: Abi family protein, partial [Muribaculaceae bacterium]|nr:Abi family protein [Muribaculaceae bacterium]
MAKSATTIEQQLDLLKSRGLTISDIEKAKEILLDVGYYRLGFYLFPFEKSYPNLRNRTHEYIEGASFEDAVNLYYFDFDLRL